MKISEAHLIILATVKRTMAMKTLAEHAADHLRDGGHTGIMWGDVHLTHEILDRAGAVHRGYKSNRLLLNALEGSKLFQKVLVRIGGRLVRSFELRANGQHAGREGGLK